MSDERLYKIVSNYKTNKKMQARKTTKEMNGGQWKDDEGKRSEEWPDELEYTIV